MCCSTPPPSTRAAPAARSSPSPSGSWACPESGSTRCSTSSSLTPEESSRRVRDYSLGMRQRLGLATALIGDPGILILDEPANGLDPAGIRWMRGLLRDFADRGGTVLLSSHLLHEIEVIADDLVVIGNGRIVAQGAKADLLASAGADGAHDRTPDPRPSPRRRRASRRRTSAVTACSPRRTPSRSGGPPSAPASPCSSCGRPTAPGWRRCSSSSPQTPSATPSRTPTRPRPDHQPEGALA